MAFALAVRDRALMAGAFLLRVSTDALDLTHALITGSDPTAMIVFLVVGVPTLAFLLMTLFRPKA